MLSIHFCLLLPTISLIPKVQSKLLLRQHDFHGLDVLTVMLEAQVIWTITFHRWVEVNDRVVLSGLGVANHSPSDIGLFHDSPIHSNIHASLIAPRHSIARAFHLFNRSHPLIGEGFIIASGLRIHVGCSDLSIALGDSPN